MDSNLLAVIIGALIGSLPACLSTIVSSMESRAARKHELQKLDIDIYHKEKLKALKDYRLVYSELVERIYLTDIYINYRSALGILDMYVNDDTHDILMTVSAFLHNQYAYYSRYPNHADDFCIDKPLEELLFKALRREMDSLHRSSGLDRSSSFEICTPLTAPSLEQTPQEETQTPAAS